MIKNIHPQLQQFINLFFLLFIGKYIASVYLSWLDIFYILMGTFCIEYFFIYLKERKFSFFSYSSLSTSIGVILMMITPNLYLYFVVIFLGLFQKHFLVYQGKHFFNPSNFALIVGLLLFYHDAHIVLGQLGDNIWLQIFVLMLSIGILYRIDRWIIPLSFSMFYIVLQYLLIIHYDPVLLVETIYHRFYSVSFIVFIIFMLTDPKTTPLKNSQQILFAFFVAFMATWLDRVSGFRVQHFFMALFLLSPTVTVLELWRKNIHKKYLLLLFFSILLLALSAIIYIEMQPPYYFEMDG